MTVISTTMNKTQLNEDRLLTGHEKFKIHGDAINEKQLKAIISACKGLKYHWNCRKKALQVKNIIGGVVILGETMILSGDLKSAYGHYFNPPYEFHAWVQLPKGVIVDVALPGLIETGLNFSDDQGPFIVGREPVVLAGRPESWMKYVPKKIY